MSKLLLNILLLSAIFYSAQSQTYKALHTSSIVLKADPDSTNQITISAPALSADVIFTLPSSYGSAGQFLSTTGNGVLSWATVTSSVTGTNKEVQINNAGAMDSDSQLIYNDTTDYLGIKNTAPTANVSVGDIAAFGTSADGGSLVLYSEQGVTDYTFTLSAPASMSNNRTFTWPDDYGSNGQLMTTNGSLGLQWTTTSVSTGNDCIGIGNDGDDTGTNTVDGFLGFVGGGTSNEVGSSGSNSFIGGGEDNTVNAPSSAIGGGENNEIEGDGYSLIGGGRYNVISDSYSAILAGEYNRIDSGASYSLIGAGRYNTIYSQYSAIAAGEYDTIYSSSPHSFIGAGQYNSITSSPNSAILAGTSNKILGGTNSLIGAGQNNRINSSYSFIASGNTNRIDSGSSNFIGAGQNNYISGSYSSIPGGQTDSITGNYSLILGSNSKITSNYSVAFGRYANPAHQGSFVLNASGVSLTSGTNNQFTAAAPEGIFFYTNSGQSNGARLQSGASSWSSVSDSNMKKNILSLNPEIISQKLGLLSIYSWSYRDAENPDVRNYGPMAQDFFRNFGEDKFGFIGTDTTIVPIHLTSIAISAIQHNDSIIKEMESELTQITNSNDDLKAQIDELERRLKARRRENE